MLRSAPMRTRIPAQQSRFFWVLLLIWGAPVWAQDSSLLEDSPQAKMLKITTNHGAITIELEPDSAPESVAAISRLVEAGHYDGTIFHRVIPGFMIQGGGFSEDLVPRRPGSNIVNESNNGLSNQRGTVALARKDDPDSATGQFFINLVDNDYLNFHQPDGWGYAVFGRVTAGLEVVDEIAKVATVQRGPHGNVPLLPVTIEKAELVPAGNHVQTDVEVDSSTDEDDAS